MRNMADKRDVSTNVDAFISRSTQWSSGTVLHQLTRADICLTAEEIVELRPMLWNDLCSEYDAQPFSQHLGKLVHKYSQDFLSFISVWQSDEWNHYLGFRSVFSLLYGEHEDEIHQRVAGRTPKFLPISEFLADEFTICLLLAYDEIATTKSYSMDHELYRSMGSPAFLKWIRLVTRDEAFHFRNCMEVIEREHEDRIHEIPAVVNKFIQWDLNPHEYEGTFVLDHTGDYFTSDFLHHCGELIVKYFR